MKLLPGEMHMEWMINQTLCMPFENKIYNFFLLDYKEAAFGKWIGWFSEQLTASWAWSYIERCIYSVFQASKL